MEKHVECLALSKLFLFPGMVCGHLFLFRATLTPSVPINLYSHLHWFIWQGKQAHMPIQIEVQKEKRQHTIYQNPEPHFFLTKKALPIRIYFYFPCDTLNSTNYSCLCTDLSSSLHGEMLRSMISSYLFEFPEVKHRIWHTAEDR